MALGEHLEAFEFTRRKGDELQKAVVPQTVEGDFGRGQELTRPQLIEDLDQAGAGFVLHDVGIGSCLPHLIDQIHVPIIRQHRDQWKLPPHPQRFDDLEAVLPLEVLSGNGWSWGPWLGAYFEMMLLVWALVRVVNLGFVEALKLAAEKHEFETLKHRAYTSGLEEEKKRIAGELHDDVLGSLVLVTHSMPLNNPFRSTLQHVIAKTRRLTMNLSPHGVAEMPLSDAIERLAKSYRSDELSVWFHLHAAPERLPESSHFELFRMAQEVLQNIYKHANANRVDISLDWDPTEGQLLLTIEDNGIGFDPDAVMKRSTGLGLANLKSRAESIGALLTIESSPGSGSYISIEWVND